MAFFRLKENPEIEYSLDFEFFKEHQVFLIKSSSNRNILINSLLESRRFDEFYCENGGWSNGGDYTEKVNSFIEKRLRNIHEKLITGQIVEGKIVS